MEESTLKYRPTTTNPDIVNFFRNVIRDDSRKIITPLLPDSSEPTLFIVKSKKSPVYEDEKSTVFGIYRYGGHTFERFSAVFSKQHLLSEIHVTPMPISQFPLFFTVFENGYFPGNLRIDHPGIETKDYKAIQELYDSRSVPTILMPRGVSLIEKTAEQKAEKVALERMHVYAKKLNLPTLDQIIEE